MYKWFVAVCAIAVGAVFLGSPVMAQSNASIKIVSPGDRRNVPVGENEVAVQISGANLQDGYTWELYLDGVPQGVVRDATTTQVVLDKPMVLRRMKAVLYDPQGTEVSSHEILIVAVKIETTKDVFNRSWFVPFMAVFFIGLVLIIIFALRIRLRHAS